MIIGQSGRVHIYRDMDDGGGSTVIVERPESISVEEWEGLGPEEREGALMTGEGEEGEVIEDDDDEPTPEELAAIAGEELDEEAAEAEDAETEAAKVAAAAEAVKVETQTAVTVTTEGLPTDEDLLAFRPEIAASELKIPKIEVPTEITAKLDALDAKEDELEAHFEDGKDGEFLSKTEYRQQLRAITKERDGLKQEAQDAVFDMKQTSRDSARANAENDKIGGKFLASRPYYDEKGTDGDTTMKADALFGALEKAVAKITKANPTMTYMQRLLKADAAVKEAFGIKGAEPAAAAATTTVKKPVKPGTPLPVIQTLSHAPASAQEETGSDPFSYLDRLSGEKLEAAIEKLKPAQRTAYENRY